MNIFITGGNGRIGRHTIEHLEKSGYSIKAIGRRTNVSIENAEYVSCDITEFKKLKKEMEGYDAVLHCAAYKSPWLATSEEVFRVNCYGTYCVFQAAALNGIDRVVVASSINALGFFFGCKYPTVHYLPINEEHPCYTTDPYSFSKTTLEDIASYFWRREGISSFCIRMGGRMTKDPQPISLEIKKDVMNLLDLPREDANKTVKQYIASFFRSKTLPPSDNISSFISRLPDSTARSIVGGIVHFWTALDIRDRAQAFEKALTADYTGGQPLFINDSHNSLGIDSIKLAKLFYPEAPLRRELKGTESLISINKARELIGYEPEYSVSRFFND